MQSNERLEVYSDRQEKLIQSEFKRLKDQFYLEHAGATLYSEKQISEALSDLKGALYANPHGHSTSGKTTEDIIDQIRFEILHHFKTDVNEYSVVFTSNATAALKLVAESFDYKNGTFAYLQDNHTSVLGMRQFAPNIKPITVDDAFKAFDGKSIQSVGDRNNLFVYPAQSNFSGTKYPLSWIEEVQKGALNNLVDVSSKKWFCFLDAAAFVPTNELNLSIYKPDFFCVSFYKIFGYPMGLGALIVKNSSIDVLEKKYYGGGTVFMALSLKNLTIPRKILHERFEDGTQAFLSIVSLRHGFETLKRLDLTMDLISEHTFLLAQYVFNCLSQLHHFNGNPAVVFYHDTNFSDKRYQGAIVNFNLLRPNGDHIGYSEVLHTANLYNIHLRTGCFCNPGACQMHLDLSTDELERHFDKGHVCGDQIDLIDNSPTGSVRISFGYMSTKRDAEQLIKMIESFVVGPILKKRNFVDKHKFYKIFQEPLKENILSKYTRNVIKTKNENVTNVTKVMGVLQQIYVYPVKSCAPFSIENTWELVSKGLKYDREWMIINESGICVTQKRNKALCLIKPYIDVAENVLRLHCNDLSITVPLIEPSYDLSCRSKVCGDYVQGFDCGDVVADWLSDVLNQRGLRLMRQCSEEDKTRKKMKNGTTMYLSLANQAPYLLVNRMSAQWLFDTIPTNVIGDTVDDFIRRFRPNFVIDFEKPFVENKLQAVVIDEETFKSNGKCTRCQMICIDQNNGEVSSEPLKALSAQFGNKLTFGIYLKREIENNNMIVINSTCIGDMEIND